MARRTPKRGFMEQFLSCTSEFDQLLVSYPDGQVRKCVRWTYMNVGKTLTIVAAAITTVATAIATVA